MSPPGIWGCILAIGGAALIPVIAALSAYLLGGCKSGRFKKTRELSVHQGELPTFLEQLQMRLEQLGFKKGEHEGHYILMPKAIQSGGASHADKGKTLTVQMIELGDTSTVNMTVGYHDLIISDTGENAHLEGLLDYLCGVTEKIAVVPNNSFGATCTLAGGIATASICAMLSFSQMQKFWFPVVVFGITYVCFGVQAIKSIRQKPEELKGMWKAVLGILLAIAGMLYALPPVLIQEGKRILSTFSK